MAARGSRKTTETVEQIADASEAAQIRRQAQRIALKAFGTALVLTALLLVLPIG